MKVITSGDLNRGSYPFSATRSVQGRSKVAGVKALLSSVPWGLC